MSFPQQGVVKRTGPTPECQLSGAAPLQGGPGEGGVGRGGGGAGLLQAEHHLAGGAPLAPLAHAHAPHHPCHAHPAGGRRHLDGMQLQAQEVARGHLVVGGHHHGVVLVGGGGPGLQHSLLGGTRGQLLHHPHRAVGPLEPPGHLLALVLGMAGDHHHQVYTGSQVGRGLQTTQQLLQLLRPGRGPPSLWEVRDDHREVQGVPVRHIPLAQLGQQPVGLQGGRGVHLDVHHPCIADRLFHCRVHRVHMLPTARLVSEGHHQVQRGGHVQHLTQPEEDVGVHV
mmetsp:Transcript_4785/g.7162  ORF Transcript_4785/g.7162 Transcript_4785/m.7162 type:complete len:282 (-) Transcript_4785:1482-2327(-)